MPDLTAQEIQQAREIARETTNPGKWFTPGHASIALMARAVLALTEQQPEPVDEDELITRIRQVVLRAGLGSRAPARAVSITLEALKELGYTITRKPQGGTDV